MPEYRKKPVIIEAVQWTGDMSKIISLAGTDLPTYGPNGQSGSLAIQTLEGTMELRLGDYLIQGVAGEYYPCKPDIFEQTYEKVERDSNGNIIPEEELQRWENETGEHRDSYPL